MNVFDRLLSLGRSFLGLKGATRDTPPFQAFISYSHHDWEHASWLHKSLEGYKVPRELVGLETAKGPVSRRLRPIFIDRYDAAAEPLDHVIEEALQCSQHLIVVCSPHSCASEHVKREICRFKQLGRGNRILALIVSGRAFDPQNECFPDALKFTTDEQCLPSGYRDREVLAASVDSDGGHLATQKLVAGMLGLRLDEIRRRHRIEEQRKRWTWRGIAGSMAVLAVAAFGFAYVAGMYLEKSINHTLQFARSVSALTEELELPADKAGSLLDNFSTVLAELSTSIGATPRPSAKLPSQSLWTVQLDGLDATAVSILSGLVLRQEAIRRAQAEMNLFQADISGRLRTAADRQQYAQQALLAYNRLRAEIPDNPQYEKGQADASFQLGMAYRDQGLLNQALITFAETLATLNESKPQSGSTIDFDVKVDRERSRALASVHYQIGVIQRRQGLLEQAIASLKTALELRLKLAPKEPWNLQGVTTDAAKLILNATIVRVELSEAYWMKGDKKRQIETLREVVRVRETLFAQLGSNQLKRYLTWSRIFLGEALLAAGESKEALEILRAAPKLVHDLLLNDQKNTRVQRDLSWAEGHLADGLLAHNRAAEANEYYVRALVPLEQALKAEPGNLATRRNVAYWLTRRGKALAAIGQTDQSKRELTRALAMLEPDTRIDMTNLQLRAELANSFFEMGVVARQVCEKSLAASSFAKAHTEYASISRAAPSVAPWKRYADETLVQMTAGMSCASPESIPSGDRT